MFPANGLLPARRDAKNAVSQANTKQLKLLQEQVVGCSRCSRLVHYCQGVAERKRRAYLAWDYWGRPVPSFGDTNARVLVIGLAPGAHGSNRTGRMFTG